MEYKVNNPADRFLVDKVLSGDTKAFRSIMKNTEGLVAQIVFKMITNKEDRKDIAQDIYLKVFQKLGNFRFQAKLSTWIAQIAYHTCLNYLEKRKLLLPDPGSGQSHEEILEKLISQPDIFNNETEILFYKKELSGILGTEIDKLPPVYKTLISLYHHEELNYTEIAEITQLPEGTVKSYLFRARKTLRDNLLLTYKKDAL